MRNLVTSSCEGKIWIKSNKDIVACFVGAISLLKKARISVKVALESAGSSGQFLGKTNLPFVWLLL